MSENNLPDSNAEMQDEPKNKTITQIDPDLLTKFYNAQSAEEQTKLLRPLAVAMLWDRGELGDAGFTREGHKVFMEHWSKIVDAMGSIDLDAVIPEKLQEIAEERGVADSVLIAQRMWKETEQDRIFVRQYIDQKQKLQGEKHEG